MQFAALGASTAKFMKALEGRLDPLVKQVSELDAELGALRAILVDAEIVRADPEPAIISLIGA
jgi:hypothetical protein